MKKKYTFLVLLASILLLSYNSFAQVVLEEQTVCKMPMSNEVRRITIMPPPALSQRISSQLPCSNIEVSYSGFTPEAQAAFERAVEIWENVLESPVTIRIEAVFETLDPGVLGGARSLGFFNVTGEPTNILYHSALAEKLNGADNGGAGAETFDIFCQFNNSTGIWYFGEDPNLIAGTNLFDFTTVVLHELGHGLGISGFGRLNEMTGEGFIRNNGFVNIWDTFITGRDIIDRPFPILDQTRFPDPSFNLLGAMTNNDLTCNSPLAVAANGGIEPKTYAPTEFVNGSSYSHWDEFTFNGTTDALMTPGVVREEVIRSVGPITQGFMKDMGWTLCNSVLSSDNFALEGVKISPNPFTESLTINLPSEVSNQEFKVTIVDINGRIVSNTSEVNNGEIVVSNLNNLGSALYFLTIESKSSDLKITKKIIKR